MKHPQLRCTIHGVLRDAHIVSVPQKQVPNFLVMLAKLVYN